jgi:hemerythrin
MTAPLQWTPDLAIGLPEIDAQHRELFRRAERLIAALRAGDGGQVLPLLDYLEAYVLLHFQEEERLMHETRYPGVAAHAAEHQVFREELARIAADFARRGPTALVALTLHNWLSDWLATHVAGVDQALGRHLRPVTPGS